MKKIILRLTMLAFITSTIISCNKIEKITKEEVKDETSSQIVTMVDINGNSITKNEIDESLEYTIYVESVENTENEFNAIYFESEDIAYDYFKKYNKYSEIVSKIDKAREIRTLAKKTGDIDLENPKWDNISDEMKVLLNKYRGVENKSEKTNGVGLLYDHLGASGLIALYTNLVFDLGTAKNRGESATQFSPSPNAFCDYTWFGGAKIWISVTPNSYINFTGNISFRNRAESVI